MVEKDSEVPANLYIIEFIESYKVNLCKEYGHFQLKMTENGLDLAQVLRAFFILDHQKMGLYCLFLL